jgi:hypothetical protein
LDQCLRRDGPATGRLELPRGVTPRPLQQ